MKIIWSPLSIDRITEIAKYIAEDNLNAAEKWLEEIFNSVEQLQTFPQSGRIVPELNEPSIRDLLFGNYRIVYLIEEKHISVLTVRNVRQILPESDLFK